MSSRQEYLGTHMSTCLYLIHPLLSNFHFVILTLCVVQSSHVGFELAPLKEGREGL